MNSKTVETLVYDAQCDHGICIPVKVEQGGFLKPADFAGYRMVLRFHYNGLLFWQNVDIPNELMVHASGSPMAVITLMDSFIANAMAALNDRVARIDNKCPRCMGQDRKCGICDGRGQYPVDPVVSTFSHLGAYPSFGAV